MAPNLDPNVSAILAAVARYPRGATIKEILASLTDAPKRRTASNRLHDMVSKGLLRIDASRMPYRYFVADDVPAATDQRPDGKQEGLAQEDQGPGTNDKRPQTASSARDVPAPSEHGAPNGKEMVRKPEAKCARQQPAKPPTPQEQVLEKVATVLAPVARAAMPEVFGGNGGGNGAGSVPSTLTAAQKRGAEEAAKQVGRYFGRTTALAALVTAVAGYAAQWLVKSPAVTIAVTAVVICGSWVLTRVRHDTAVRPAMPDGTGSAPAGASADSHPADVAAAAQSGPAPAMSPPTRTRNVFIIGACVIAIIAIMAVGRYWQMQQVPPNSAVEDFLVKSVTPVPVHIPNLHVVPGTSTAMGLNLTYDARFETSEPLYRRVDAMEYLKAHAVAELAQIDAASAILKGPNGSAVRARIEQGAAGKEQGAAGLEQGAAGLEQGVGSKEEGRSDKPGAMGTSRSTAGAQTPTGYSLNPQFSSLNSVVLVTTATPPGATAVTSGKVIAWKRDGAWQITGDPVRLDRTAFVGEPKPAGAFAIDVPADEARLKALLSEQVSYAARVQAAAGELAAEVQRQHAQRVASFADLLRSGTLLMGTASGTTTSGAIRITLEIASSSAGSSHLTALLRNDGGWADTRLFQGEWSVPSDSDTCTIMLRSGRDDRITSAGPLLEDNREVAVTLQVRPDGTASGVPDNWQLRRVDAADITAVKAGFSRAIGPALAATKPGLLYRGTVTSQVRGTNETLVLRFTAQDPDGVRVEASLESMTVASWARVFRGSVVDNTYRAGSTPIRLRSLDSARIAQAPTTSMLALATGNDSVALNLRVDGTRLTGQDGHFTYVFELAEPGWAPPGSALSGQPSAGSSGSAASSQQSATSGQPSAIAGSSSFNSQPSPFNSGAPAPAGRALPPFPGTVGAYVLSDDGQWLPLPRNNGRIVQSAVQKANAFFGWLNQAEAKIAGTKVPDQNEVTGQWMFDGTTPVPVVSGDDVVVIYAGPLVISPSLLAKYPQLAMEPLMEMAPLWVLDSGVRAVPLTSPVKNIYGFGPLRVPVTLERPTLAITLMHCTTRLPARHYAVACGDTGYEFAVQ
jgi:hypothetical protein